MFEKNLVLNHLQTTRFWVMDLYVASQLLPRDQFKVSQRSKLQVALLKEPTSPVVIVQKKSHSVHSYKVTVDSGFEGEGRRWVVICRFQHPSGLSGALMTDKNKGPICH